MTEPKTRVDEIKAKLMNHPLVSGLIIIGMVVIAIAAFTDATSKIVHQVRNFWPDNSFKIEGSVFTEYGAQSPKNIKATIFWAVYSPQEEVNRGGFGGTSTWDVLLSGGDTAFQDSRVATVNSSTGQLNYKITLDSPPPDAILTDLDGIKLGVGYIGAFDDVNTNSLYDRDEDIIVVASERAITYLKGDIRSIAVPPKGSRRRDRLYTLQQLPQGYSLVKAVPAEVHKFPVPYADLVPIQLETINLIIPKDRSEIKVPHWLDGLWLTPAPSP